MIDFMVVARHAMSLICREKEIQFNICDVEPSECHQLEVEVKWRRTPTHCSALHIQCRYRAKHAIRNAIKETIYYSFVSTALTSPCHSQAMTTYDLSIISCERVYSVPASPLPSLARIW